MTTEMASGRLRALAVKYASAGALKATVRTAGFNLASTLNAGLGGVILARYLGPAGRGDYAAVTAWFAFACIIGDLGLPGALCFYVAREPELAGEYVATSRAIMIVTGSLAAAVGVFIAPILSHGIPAVTLAYRVAFLVTIVAVIGASYIYGLQARDLHRWNIVRVSQPTFSLIAICVLWQLRLLSLVVATYILAGTVLLQLALAYYCCRRVSLVPGRSNTRLIRPLITYGIAQIAGSTPGMINVQLDQLVLSQTVSAGDLGRYAIAVSLTMLPMPIVSAIGNVAFPRLASQRVITNESHRLQQLALLSGAVLALSIVVPLGSVAYWLVPLIFGPAYSGAVPLLWILCPGAVFLATGQVASDLLRGRKRPMVIGRAHGLAAVFTIVILSALLPFIGVYAAAIASTAAYAVALLVMVRALHRSPKHARERSGVRAIRRA
ncbi:MAG: oligosaccharide flippase family protein [Gammaproteobacteria bacterium]